MPWEWVAPAAGVAGAVLGSVTTWLVARANQRAHERLAREARRDPRRIATYEEIHKLLEAFRVSVGKAAFEEDGRYLSGLVVPPLESRSAVRALVGVHGSAQIKTLCYEYLNLLEELDAECKTFEHRRS